MISITSQVSQNGLLQANTNVSNSSNLMGQINLSPLDINSIELNLNGFDNKYVKKYEVFESTEDLLVLSCVLYRLVNERQKTLPNTYFFVHNEQKLLQPKLFEEIIEQDRILAQQIRDYYSKKIMIWKIKGVKFTRFREDLNTFIHSDGYKFQEKMTKLVYKLPQFYFEDLYFDEITKEVEKYNLEKIIFTKPIKLKHLGTVEVNRKGFKTYNNYWFVNDNNELCLVAVDKLNTLRCVWESLIKNEIHVTGKIQHKTRDDYEYYKISSVELK